MQPSLPGAPVTRRLALVFPCALLLASGLVLGVAALGASGAAREVRYPDSTPVYAGLIAATPAVLFGAAAVIAIWLRTFGPFEVRPLRLVLGLIAILAATVMIIAYAVVVDSPGHYKGELNPVTLEWEPRVPTAGSYLSLVLGVATFFPMGALAVTAKYLYIDAIQPAKLDRPEGYDPIGIMLRTGDGRT